MKQWYMLTIVGQDRPGIVAGVTRALFEGGCNLGETSMMRLGGNFTIMLMALYSGDASALSKLLDEPAREMNLRVHVDEIEGRLHQHLEPDVRITVHGADRPGIVALVTGVLAQAGFNILDLESDVGGDEQNPIYIMHIEGAARNGLESLSEALQSEALEGVNIRLAPIDALLG